MKKIFSLLLVFGAFVIFGTSCGDDPLRPKIYESTITCSELTLQGVTITFKAECPEGTSVKARFLQRTNGTKDTIVDTRYRFNIETYYVYYPRMVAGSLYAYYIIGYDSDGKQCYVSEERTFQVPKNKGPEAPAIALAKAYPPSSLVASDGYIECSSFTKSLEYSVDEEKTWTAITEEGVIKGLRSGKVLIRWAETSTTEAGKTAFVVVPSYKSNTDLDGSDGTSEGVTSTGPKQWYLL